MPHTSETGVSPLPPDTQFLETLPNGWRAVYDAGLVGHIPSERFTKTYFANKLVPVAHPGNAGFHHHDMTHEAVFKKILRDRAFGDTLQQAAGVAQTVGQCKRFTGALDMLGDGLVTVVNGSNANTLRVYDIGGNVMALVCLAARHEASHWQAKDAEHVTAAIIDSLCSHIGAVDPAPAVIKGFMTPDGPSGIVIDAYHQAVTTAN